MLQFFSVLYSILGLIKGVSATYIPYGQNHAWHFVAYFGIWQWAIVFEFTSYQATHASDLEKWYHKGLGLFDRCSLVTKMLGEEARELLQWHQLLFWGGLPVACWMATSYNC